MSSPPLLLLPGSFTFLSFFIKKSRAIHWNKALPSSLNVTNTVPDHLPSIPSFLCLFFLHHKPLILSFPCYSSSLLSCSFKIVYILFTVCVNISEVKLISLLIQGQELGRILRKPIRTSFCVPRVDCAVSVRAVFTKSTSLQLIPPDSTHLAVSMTPHSHRVPYLSSSLAHPHSHP